MESEIHGFGELEAVVARCALIYAEAVQFHNSKQRVIVGEPWTVTDRDYSLPSYGSFDAAGQKTGRLRSG